MKLYQHTQKAVELVVMLSALSLVLMVSAAFLPLLLLAAALTALAARSLHSLTVEITDADLQWRFGPAWIRRSVPLKEIVSARTVRLSFLEGWGIHYSRFGWLYNVWGCDAVAVILRNGKRFCLGTDEPEILCAALRSLAESNRPAQSSSSRSA